MAVDAPIPKPAVAERADMPSHDPDRTRVRRSSLKAGAISPPTESLPDPSHQKSTTKESHFMTMIRTDVL